MRKIAFILILIITACLIACSTRQKPQMALTLTEKIGQMLIVGFDGTELSDEFAKQLKEYNVGGVILFDRNESNPTELRNIENPTQLKKLVESLQDVSDTPLLIAVDQEGGEMSRLHPANGFFTLPSAKYLGDLNRSDSSQYYARLNALQLNDLGININFAPCVDVNVNPDNPVIGKRERSYSDDPWRVVEEADIVITEYHRSGVLNAIKHFPGHGSSKNDSRLGFVDVTETFEDIELLPYRELVKRGKVDMINVGHLFNKHIDPDYPASLSKLTIEKLLRKDIGYDGVVATDDMHMGAITKEYSYEKALELAINAGADIILVANNAEVYYVNLVETTVNTINQLVEEGKITPERIDEAYNRIWKLKERLK